jgi:hypothetical protein
MLRMAFDIYTDSCNMCFKIIFLECLVMCGVVLLGLGEENVSYIRLLLPILRIRNKVTDAYCGRTS